MDCAGAVFTCHSDYPHKVQKNKILALHCTPSLVSVRTEGEARCATLSYLSAMNRQQGQVQSHVRLASRRAASMSVRNTGSLKKNSARIRRFFIAGARHDLYDSRKVSPRVPRQDLIATTRAIILVALTGGAIWFLLWKLAAGVWGKR